MTASTGVATLTHRVARFISALRYADLPAVVVDRSRQAILDTVGVALAAVPTDIGQGIIGYVQRQGGHPLASVLGGGFATAPGLAALANGTLAHALDYDDTSYGMNGHLSSILVATLFALGEQAAGEALITAYVAGFELGSRLGRDMNPDHYESGWHSTATLGHLAAAAAAAHLLGLDESQTAAALGIAATEAGGLRASIGSMAKPLHSGLAARNGVLAAELAQLGWTAADDAFGAPFGFAAMFAPGKQVGPALADLGHTWDVETAWVAQKPYPSCAATHRALDALLDLRSQSGFGADDVAEIRCGVDYMVPTYMVYPEPLTPEEARFSMEYTLAVATLDGRVGLDQYAPQRIADPAVRSLGRRVRMYIHPDEAGRESWQVRFVDLDVVLHSGQTLNARVYEQRGHPHNPLSVTEQNAKYRETAACTLSPAAVEESLEMIRGLNALPSVAPLAALLRNIGAG